MRIQVLSDLHLETEDFTPQAAPGAELLVLAGDIDSSWTRLQRFANWPVPVLFVAGNHEFDGRDINQAWPALRQHCGELGLQLLERQAVVLTDANGRRIRFVGSIRWCDFEVYGAKHRDRAMRAAGYFVKVMRATMGGEVFDPARVREQGLACREWLASELQRRPDDPGSDTRDWHATVVITHYAPSLRSADPRFGATPTTASFCNADDALLPLADVWIHGHLHCRHDWRVEHTGGHVTRVVSNARGHSHKGETAGYDPLWVMDC